MSLQPASSFRKTKNSFLKRFQQEMNVLKYEVEAFNCWENSSSALNIQAIKKNNESKKFLKKLTQSKYNQTVMRIVDTNQIEEPQTTKKSILCRKERIRDTLTKPESIQLKVPTRELQVNIFQSLSRTQKLKTNGIRISIKKKNKVLQKEWSKMESYRSQNSIYGENINPGGHKKEKIIINKIMLNRRQVQSAMAPSHETEHFQ